MVIRRWPRTDPSKYFTFGLRTGLVSLMIGSSATGLLIAAGGQSSSIVPSAAVLNFGRFTRLSASRCAGVGSSART